MAFDALRLKAKRARLAVAKKLVNQKRAQIASAQRALAAAEKRLREAEAEIRDEVALVEKVKATKAELKTYRKGKSRKKGR